MDPAALAGRLEAVEGRLAGTDAERRAAALLGGELRTGGRRPRTRTLWFRPRRELARATCAAVGVAGSVVAVGNAKVGLGLAAGALLVAILESAGVPIVSLLQTRRATQNVIVAPRSRDERRVLLVLATSADVPRDDVLSRLEARLPSRFLPGATALLLLALAGVAGCAGARLAGAEGTVIGAVQLLPSIVLILLLGGFTDAAVAGPAETFGAGGPAAAAAVLGALDAQPPRALAVEALVVGAGESGAAGMRRYVRERRRELAPENVVVVALRSGGTPVRTATRHPQLRRLAERIPGAEPSPGRGEGAARIARGARWPAITLEGEPRAIAAAALRLVAAIDAEVGSRP